MGPGIVGLSLLFEVLAFFAGGAIFGVCAVEERESSDEFNIFLGDSLRFFVFVLCEGFSLVVELYWSDHLGKARVPYTSECFAN
jgi:hypothetical protein